MFELYVTTSTSNAKNPITSIDAVARVRAFYMSEHKLLYHYYKDRDKYHFWNQQMDSSILPIRPFDDITSL